MPPLKMQYKMTGKGKDLVLVPGGLTGWVSWDPFVPYLSATNNVVQVQLLSVQYGLEDKDLPENYSVRMESEALAESLREAGISTPTDFIGWSFGAFVLLDFSLNHPGLVRSITLIEPPAFWILNAQNHVKKETNDIMMFIKTLQGDISENQLEVFMTTVGFAPPGTSLKQHPQWNNWINFRRSLRNGSQVVNHNDDFTRLKRFDRPVLLIKGTGSADFLHEIIHLLDQEFPNSQIVELSEGHAPHIVSKDEFLGVVQKFHGLE